VSLDERSTRECDLVSDTHALSWRRACHVSERSLWLIAEMPGFAPQIGRLVSMMNYVRSTTLSDVAGLDEEEQQRWGAALDLGESARREIRGHELEYYVSRLERVREKTLRELGLRADQWLEERTSAASGREVNNYFKWFHVMGHEINHRGQIRWLRTRATRQPQ
jgi:hypothetical protein